MKLSIINCVNGNFSVVAEGITTDQTARVQFHDRCKVLWTLLMLSRAKSLS